MATAAAHSDELWMDRALQLAAKAVGRVRPNPAVGAVVVRDGAEVGAGWTQAPGGHHAEVEAIRRAGARAKGATLYSTLEPCSHHGRTPPCADRIVAAGIRRVVVGVRDPNPLVSGRGLRRLRAAGLTVVTGVRREACREAVEAFAHAIVHGSPWVVLKLAMSLDGRVATRTGESRWITGPAARRQGHRLRHVLDAIVVGSGTVLADDPALTARIPGGTDPIRVVLDRRLRTPATAEVVRTARTVETVICTDVGAAAARRRRLERAGCTVLPYFGPRRSGAGALRRLLRWLYEERGVNGVLLEGGPTVSAAFWDAGLVHRVEAFVAPRLLGGERARAALPGRGVGPLDAALHLEAVRWASLGTDLWLRGYVPGARAGGGGRKSASSKGRVRRPKD